ncbi:MAG: SRPBCC family protein [Myxococcaceae bacterium]
MRVLKFFAIAIIGIAVLTVGIGLLLPRTWSVNESIVIDAPPERVADEVKNFHNWQHWVFWNDSDDPEVKRTFSDQQGVPGASTSWNGPRMGRGKLTVSKVEPGSIAFDEQLESDEVNAHGMLSWREESGRTEVTWHDEGLLPAVMGGYFRSVVQRGLSDHFKTALEKLKAHVEQTAQAGVQVDAGVAAAPDSGT